MSLPMSAAPIVAYRDGESHSRNKMTSLTVYHTQRARHHVVLRAPPQRGERGELPSSPSALVAAESDQTVHAYRRDLPGSGFIAIDVHRARSRWWRPRRFEGEVIVERRGTPRGGRHISPVIARAVGGTIDDVVGALLPVARCNETIGAALLRLDPRSSRQERDR